MRNAFMGAVFEACKSRDDIMILSGDTGAGLFDDFKKQYPDRFLNMGIAEQNMASFAAGLAMTGKKVIIYNIIPFLLYRCYEQVRNDICYQEVPVVLVGVGSGLTYAPQGMTHYSVEDLGICQTLPNLTVISPGFIEDAEKAATYALNAKEPVYVRIAKVGGPKLSDLKEGEVKLPVVRPGENVAIVFHGSIVSEVMTAYEELVKEGKAPLLVDMPQVQPLPEESLGKTLESIKTVIVVEEHYSNCGLGSIIANNKYLWDNASWDLVVMGIEPGFVHEVKDLAGMRKHYKISAQDIAEEVREAWVQ
jgi:transketolase